MTQLERQFHAFFGAPGPSLLVTVPGRVNLMGDHIDYVGLSVLPMAIQHRLRVAVRPRGDRTVRVANNDPAFQTRAFDVGADLAPYPDGDWGNYLKAAVVHLERRYGNLHGFDALVDSTLSVASGLSSSSALVIGAALSAIAGSGLDVPMLELAHELAEAERYVGTRGGGMDQAICLGARPGCVSRVDFDPLAVSAMPIPQHWRFVVASSLVRAEKSASAREAYNARRRYVEQAVAAVGAALEGTVPATRRLLDAFPSQDLMEMSARVLDEVSLRRFRHVLTEAARVHRAVRALDSNESAVFGSLMYRSHESLRVDFEVSCPELDAMVAIAADAGAEGARVTGAGFGGCIVVLSTAEAVGAVTAALRDDFYRARIGTDAVDDAMFVAVPSGGATVEPLR